MLRLNKVMNATLDFIAEAFLRIFSPTDDAYPVIGVQPFSGEISSNPKAYEMNW